MEDRLPRSIVYRKKMGLPTPWEYWLVGPQLDNKELMLLEPRSILRGLFRPEAIRRMFAQHRAKSRDHGNRIWRLLNFETWYRVLIEGDAVENAVPCGNSTNIVLT